MSKMRQLGDFTANLRLILLSLLAIPVGAICAVVAMVLVRLIGFFTYIFFYLPSPAHEYEGGLIPNELLFPAHAFPQGEVPWWVIFIPVIGGLLIGLLARFGSEQIRGHGIPEAIEAILIGRSRMKPRVAVFKPLSSAVVIGSGGPFGAEGPIIMTGGAFGSIFAQIFKLSAAERKTLLVAGAAGGMAAIFGTPIAAVLIAVELLLFELKPRSLVPVAVGSIVATLLRPYLGLEGIPIFPVDPHKVEEAMTLSVFGSSAIVGILGGALALILTIAVYAAEDAFERLPIHWMWWPAIGGLVVGIGGYFEPRALGVGYVLIEQLLTGEDIVFKSLIILIVVKAVIWAVSLGSGTSGGVLAPLMIMGAAMGALAAPILPGGDASMWALMGMVAVMGGTMRCPLTSVVFALEITHDIGVLLPMLVASILAHGFTTLVMRRSILTEKVARRGYHVSREYSVDPLEHMRVEEAMSPDVVCVAAATPVDKLIHQYFLSGDSSQHGGYPVVNQQQQLMGVITRSSLLENWMSGHANEMEMASIIAEDLITRSSVTAYAGESCRTAAGRMARADVGRLPVVSEDNAQQVIGILTRNDLLKARARLAEEEGSRQRFFRSFLPNRSTGGGEG